MANKVDTVPNQRVLTIHKEPTDKQHKYTVNNLEAMGEAAKRLQSKGGFKLYMYLAKNQEMERWVLSSSHFCEWSGLGIAAYRTAFNELEKEGYLIPKDKTKEKETIFTFYDKAQIEDEAAAKDEITIENTKDSVEARQQLQKMIDEGFKF